MSYEAWGEPDDPTPDCPYCEEREVEIKNHVTMLRRLIYALSKQVPETNDLLVKAKAYMKHNCDPANPLRAGSPDVDSQGTYVLPDFDSKNDA